jgi:hypothetical protein
MPNMYAQQRIFYAYSKLQGFSTQDAQRLYIEEAKLSPLFGAILYRGYYEAKLDRKLGISEDGVLVQQEDESKWEFYHYRDLQTINITETGVKFVFKTVQSLIIPHSLPLSKERRIYLICADILHHITQCSTPLSR